MPSILTVIAQFAQLGPILLYPLLKWAFPRLLTNKRVIYAKLVIEIVSMILLGFFWNKTVNIFNENKSIGLYIINFLFSFFGNFFFTLFYHRKNEVDIFNKRN